MAVGRPQPGAGGVVHSYEEALSTLELAERLDLDEPVVHAADLLGLPGAHPRPAGDGRPRPQRARAAEGRAGGAESLLRTLEVYFESGCTAAEAARPMALSVRALTYRWSAFTS